MTPTEVEAMIRNLNTRMTGIEQILPTLATKDDLKVFATKDDLKTQIDDVSRQVRVLHEQVTGDIGILAEHLAHVSQVVDDLARRK